MRPCGRVSIFNCLVAHCTRERRETHQLVKNTAVQGQLGLSAFPQILVVILETFPVGRKLLQAVGVDILDPAHTQTSH